ncbi:hypothetical protein MHYP_G00043070 [Metynnis hypsauchen]
MVLLPSNTITERRHQGTLKLSWCNTMLVFPFPCLWCTFFMEQCNSLVLCKNKLEHFPKLVDTNCIYDGSFSAFLSSSVVHLLLYHTYWENATMNICLGKQLIEHCFYWFLFLQW